MTQSSKWSLPFNLYGQKCVHILLSPVNTTSSGHLILSDTIAPIAGAEYKPRTLNLCNFSQVPLTSRILGPNILLCTVPKYPQFMFFFQWERKNYILIFFRRCEDYELMCTQRTPQHTHTHTCARMHTHTQENDNTERTKERPVHAHKRTAHQRNTDGRTPKYDINKKHNIKNLISAQCIVILTRQVPEEGLLWSKHVARPNI
jgi:hypothetical protein